MTPVAPKKIVFVCTGNTCRSPMAEVLFRRELARIGLAEKFDVSSCGLATTDGEPASENAQKAVEELHANLSTHRSRMARTDFFKDGALVVTMTPRHLEAFAGTGIPALCIGNFLPDGTSSREIPDPFGGTMETYRTAREAIVSAFPRLIAFLKND